MIKKPTEEETTLYGGETDIKEDINKLAEEAKKWDSGELKPTDPGWVNAPEAVPTNSNKRRILVLDDDKYRHAHFKKVLDLRYALTQVYTHDACIEALEKQPRFDVIFLDHDLNMYEHSSMDYSGGGMYGSTESYELTGYHVAHYIARKLEEAKHPELIVIHSWNPTGSKDMEYVLKLHTKIKVRRSPFQGPQDFDQNNKDTGADILAGIKK